MSLIWKVGPEAFLGSPNFLKSSLALTRCFLRASKWANQSLVRTDVMNPSIKKTDYNNKKNTTI